MEEIEKRRVEENMRKRDESIKKCKEYYVDGDHPNDVKEHQSKLLHIPSI